MGGHSRYRWSTTPQHRPSQGSRISLASDGWAGHGNRPSDSGRAGGAVHVGIGWLPVPGVTLENAKAAAVFLNSTAGRLQLLRNPWEETGFSTV